MAPFVIWLSASAIFFVAHYVLWQVMEHKGVFVLACLAAVSHALVTIVAWMNGIAPFAHAWVSGPLMLFTLMLYLHFYVGIDRSVSVRILGELVERGGHAMTRAELEAVYPKESMFTHRLDLMAETGWLSKDGERYAITTKAERLVRMTLYLKNLFGMKTTG